MKRLALLGLVAAVFALAACGGDDGDGDGTAQGDVRAIPSR